MNIDLIKLQDDIKRVERLVKDQYKLLAYLADREQEREDRERSEQEATETAMLKELDQVIVRDKAQEQKLKSTLFKGAIMRAKNAND